jgi:hypothetical protein
MDDLLMTTATALVSKSAEAAAAAGLKALSHLHQIVKARFAHSPASRAALERAQNDPSDHANITVLAHTLELALEADPQFADLVRNLLPQVRSELNSTGTTTIANTVHNATNSTTIQIGTITHHNSPST